MLWFGKVWYGMCTITANEGLQPLTCAQRSRTVLRLRATSQGQHETSVNQSTPVAERLAVDSALPAVADPGGGGGGARAGSVEFLDLEFVLIPLHTYLMFL